MPTAIDENIFGLDVSINDAETVHVTDCERSLDEIHFGLFLSHITVILHYAKKFPARTVIQEKDEKLASLDIVMHLNHKRMV